MMDEQDFESRIGEACVFYRMAPAHKMKIVKALQHRGYIVAMTGDGVNDAPALKLSDIGISMGKSGTDVSKEAAEMILVDDNFATIEVAIEEGKSIFNNIKNFLRYQLATSITCMGLIIYCTLRNIPLPLNPTQILWINIIMDGPPAQSLGVEPTDPDVMKQPPRDPKAPILSRRVIFSIITSAIVMVIGTLYVFLAEMEHDGTVTNRDTTMTFTTFVMFQVFNALNCRHEKKSVFQIGLFSNKAFLFAIGGSILCQLGLIYLPFMNFVFETEKLSLGDLLYVTAIASSVWIVEEVFKFFLRQQQPTIISDKKTRTD
jgi:Ca2+-transporting ATPase